jgi:hypothetical protein
VTHPALFSSASVDWLTPPEVFEALAPLGPVGLDPCGAEGSYVGAAREFRLERGEDGLTLPWVKGDLPGEHQGGYVFCNPPYSRLETPRWTARCAEQAALGVEVVALLPVRTSAAWWQRHAPRADACCFIDGRLHFSGAKWQAPFASALLYWGPRWGTFRDALDGHYGYVTLGRGR